VTDDLVKRLREETNGELGRLDAGSRWGMMIVEAADRIEELEKSLSKMQEDVDFLNRLRAHGVDNWDGYELALGEDDDD